MEPQLVLDLWGTVALTGPVGTATIMPGKPTEITMPGEEPVTIKGAGWSSRSIIDLSYAGYLPIGPREPIPADGRWRTIGYTLPVRRRDDDVDRAVAARIDAVTDAVLTSWPTEDLPSRADDVDPPRLSVYPAGGYMPSTEAATFAALYRVAYRIADTVVPRDDLRGEASTKSHGRLSDALVRALWGTGSEEIRAVATRVRRDDVLDAVLHYIDPVSQLLLATARSVHVVPPESRSD